MEELVTKIVGLLVLTFYLFVVSLISAIIAAIIALPFRAFGRKAYNVAGGIISFIVFVSLITICILHYING